MTPGRFFVLFIFVVGAIGTVVSGANFYVRTVLYRSVVDRVGVVDDDAFFDAA